MSAFFTLLTAATGTGASAPLNSGGKIVGFQIVASAGGTSAVIRLEASVDGTNWTPIASTDDTNTTAASITALPSVNRAMVPPASPGFAAFSYWRANVTTNTGGVPITVRGQVAEV